ncbi:MAG TPA: YceI family protein [Candidatus Paenalcaligenes intestinipullorum]|uniref:YceI family protein n=1 Tax=Candidatus Paenalcaligenes intestinipullorum TaxID=2838718 RepID=A0A9D2RID0_9BURK|nr:YceI family protein [Candidatus Paenalcaligenes intestinipullorum]
MFKKLCVLGLSTCLLAPAAWANWHVDNDDSELYFLSTKATNTGVTGVTERFNFDQISGTLTDQGKIRFELDVASLDTDIDIRDERMKEKLFLGKEHPKIVFEGEVDPTKLKKLETGHYKDLDLEGKLTINGHHHPIEADLRVVQLADGKLAVHTLEPILIKAEDFKLKEGLATLQEIAGLALIVEQVPVNFSLILTPQK